MEYSKMKFFLSFLLLALFLLAKTTDGRKDIIGDYWGKRAIEYLKYDFLKEEGKSVPKYRGTKYTSFTKDFEPRPNPASGWHGKDYAQSKYTSFVKDFEPRPNPASGWHGKDVVETKYTSFGKEYEPKLNPAYEPKLNPAMEGNSKVI